LIETFFGTTPPGIMVLSATLHLPIQRPEVKSPAVATDTNLKRQPGSDRASTPALRANSGFANLDRQRSNDENLRDIRRELRELSYHPENYLQATHLLDGESSTRVMALVDEKQRWIHTPVTHENAYTRWNSFRRINNELQPWVAQRRQEMLELQSQVQRALRHEKVLGSREYGFCLYPESYLRDFFSELLPKIA